MNSRKILSAAILTVIASAQYSALGQYSALALETSSAPTSTAEAVAESTDPWFNTGEVRFDANPALQPWHYEIAISAVKGAYASHHASRPIVVEEGRNSSFWQLDARSWMPLTNRSAVWGFATYNSGKRTDVRWNNCTDYRLLSPYTLGDSVGGKLTSHQYRFGGGYAIILGDWSVGAKATYRASIDYRNRDPRLKIVVSDLNVGIGATHSIGSGYVAGLSAGVRVYNQESSLQFYNPLNNILTYALTGAGTYYPRFSGNNNENSAYTFTGFNASLQLSPKALEGVMFTGTYTYYKTNQILRDFNNLTLSHVASHLFEGNAVWRTHFGVWRQAVEANVAWNRRLGTEVLFGTSVGNTYEPIAERTFYYHDIVDATLSLPASVSVIPGAANVIIVPAVDFVFNRENYRTPKRNLQYHSFTPNISVGYHQYAGLGGFTLSANLHGGYMKASATDCTLVGLNPESSLGMAVRDNYLNATANRLDFGASLTVGHEIGRNLLLHLTASYAHRNYDSRLRVNDFDVTVAINF